MARANRTGRKKGIDVRGSSVAEAFRNGVEINRTYDPSTGALKEEKTTKGQAVMDDKSFSYDPAGEYAQTAPTCWHAIQKTSDTTQLVG